MRVFYHILLHLWCEGRPLFLRRNAHMSLRKLKQPFYFLWNGVQ